MDKVPDSVLEDIVALSTSREKIRISQLSPRWGGKVDRAHVREHCLMRIHDAHSNLFNAMWRRPEREWLAAARRYAPEELYERATDGGEDDVIFVQLRGRAAESWQQERDIHVEHARCLTRYLWLLRRGRGTEEAELRAERFWERSQAVWTSLRVQMARSILSGYERYRVRNLGGSSTSSQEEEGSSEEVSEPDGYEVAPQETFGGAPAPGPWIQPTIGISTVDVPPREVFPNTNEFSRATEEEV